MNIEGDNLICACLQGISQNLNNEGRSHEANLKYMKTLESLFRTWFGSSIDDEFRRWCEQLNQGRGIHADIFQGRSDVAFRDRNFWKTAAFDHIDRHIKMRQMPAKTSSSQNAAAAKTNSLFPIRSLNMQLLENSVKDEDVKLRYLDALALHSGHIICVSAGPQLPDDTRMIAVAFEDLTLQIVQLKGSALKVLSSTRFAPSMSVQQKEIDVVSMCKEFY